MSRVIGLPYRHTSQIQFCADPARFKVLAAGRRWGKRIIGISECFRRSLQGQTCWWIAPTYTSASYSSAWSMVTDFSKQIRGCYVNQQKHRVVFSTRYGRGWFQIKSAEEPDSLRGEGIDLVIVDEAAYVRNLKDLWEQCLRPTLSDRKGGAWFISTPHGYNFFHSLYQRGEHKTDEDSEWSSHHYPSSSNPYLLREEIETAKRELPALVFRQEYEAEFVQLRGMLFKREWFDADGVIVDEPPVCETWVRAWDLAFSQSDISDYTVGVKAGITKDGILVIAHVVRGRWDWPEAQRVIIATARSDGSHVAQAIEDCGTQKGYLQLLKREPALVHVRLTATRVPDGAPARDKITRAMPLLARAEAGKIRLKKAPWNKDLIDELTAFPEGEHDDQVDALSAALNHLGRSTAIRSVQGIRIGTPTISINRFNITKLR